MEQVQQNQNAFNKKNIHKHSQRHKSKPYSKHFKVNKNLQINEKTLNRLENSDNFEDVPLPNKGRHYTVSIAVPASILEDTCLKEDLRTYLVGQLARSATIYGVDEIVVYNDHCWKRCADNSEQQMELIDLMCTVLQYQEVPQYLRKALCPMSKHLSRAGVLNPTAAPHHLKAHQWCPYREGVVVGKNGKAGSLVDVGLGRNIAVSDKAVVAGSRVTVKLPPAARVMASPCGELVSPTEPRTSLGLHWGYTVRVADSLAQVLSECEDSEGYDYLLGTSDRGTSLLKLQLPAFKKLLIVFGGVDGLEECLSRDKALTAPRPEDLFHAYVNVCPRQSARTIRTEEAVPITLAMLSQFLPSV